MCMNFVEKKNLWYRFVSSFFLLLNLGVVVFALVEIIRLRPDDVPLMLVAISVTTLFICGECFFILKGWKKESYLYKIVFNENDKINTIPLIASSVGLAFGLGLLGMSIAVFIINADKTIKASMLVVLSISIYLVVNCLIYFFYLLLFKKRPINIKNFIK